MTQGTRSPRLAPSLLAADFGRLAEAVGAAEAAGADLLHLDIMDGRFVPNLSFGPAVVELCREHSALPRDVHLMVQEPERYLGRFLDAGADLITVHAEVSPQLHRSLQVIRDGGAKAGLAFNPLSPLEVLRDALPELDLVLVMSVNPGFGGQRFIPGSLARLRRVAALRDELNPACLIEVDGGIDAQTAPQAARAGADVLVAGSAVFGGSGSVAENLAALRARL